MARARYMVVDAGTTLAVDGPVVIDLATTAGQSWLAATQSGGHDVVPEQPTSGWSWKPGHEPEEG